MFQFRVRLIEDDRGQDATWLGDAADEDAAVRAARAWLVDTVREGSWSVVEVLRLGPAKGVGLRAVYVEELAYCLRILDSCGVPEVPREALQSYLEVQVASARSAGLPEFAEAFRRATSPLALRGPTDLACDEVAHVLSVALAAARGRGPGFAYEVTTAGDRGVYSRNALVFPTREEAEEYGRDLAARWTAVKSTPTTEPRVLTKNTRPAPASPKRPWPSI